VSKTDEIYKLLSNKTVRKTISLLAEKGSLRATQIIEMIGCSPGTFYDALKKMQEFVKKKEDGSYMLTDRGLELYNIILKQEKGQSMIESPLLRFTLSLPYIFPIRIFTFLNEQKRIHLFLFFAILVYLNSLILSFSQNPLLFYLLIPIKLNSMPFLFFIYFFVNSIISFAICYFFSILFNLIRDSLRLFFLFPLTYLPSTLYNLIIISFNLSTNDFLFMTLQVVPLFFTFTFIVSILWSQTKSNIEACFIVSFILIMVSLFSSQFILFKIT